MPSKTGKRASDKGFLGMRFELYLKLLDWTGRQMRRDYKKGRIPAELAPIMERIGLSGELWCDVVKRFGKIFKRVAGTPESLAQEAFVGDKAAIEREVRHCRAPVSHSFASEL